MEDHVHPDLTKYTNERDAIIAELERAKRCAGDLYRWILRDATYDTPGFQESIKHIHYAIKALLMTPGGIP